MKFTQVVLSLSLEERGFIKTPSPQGRGKTIASLHEGWEILEMKFTQVEFSLSLEGRGLGRG